MRFLLLPDIHGRKFWEKPCKDISQYDKVIFIGDYVDPYAFEHISVPDAIDNMQNIIDLKKNYPDKVILLLGNHCMPYFSDEYYRMHRFHSRHSSIYHDQIHDLYNDNKNLFQLAYASGDILFTHAGVTSTWFEYELEVKEHDPNKIADEINGMLSSMEGIQKLFMVSSCRGGWDSFSSCIWADIKEFINEDKERPLGDIKQVFGHSLQAYYDMNYDIIYGDILEFTNNKMIDNCRPYELDTDAFTIKEVVY